MNRTVLCVLCVMIAMAAMPVCAVAQEYALQDYMPQKVGSTWTMKSSGGQGDETLTVEVARGSNHALF